MIGYSIVSGILFGILNGVINANPLAQRLYEVYKPIARTSVNLLAGIVIDLVYGFVMVVYWQAYALCFSSTKLLSYVIL